MEINKFYILGFLISLFNGLSAQSYTDYIGAGHKVGVTITASSNITNSSPSRTMDGSGMNAKLFDASRFLGQSTFGANLEMIEDASDMGFEPWIDDQFTKPAQPILPLMYDIWNEIYTADSTAYGPWALHFNYAWWQRNMTNDDLLRQRVAYALSQILVTSINSDLREWGESVSSYYDIFINNAFGNYKDILLNVTKHPAMGYYLSHLNNPPEDLANNIHPDENFAREIMQLFTIGLYQLNANGTRVLDGNGDGIPTYTNNDIKQLAKVFTGMGGGTVLEMMYCPEVPEFGTNMYCLDKTAPMIMFPFFHEPGSKSFLGFTIPGSTTYNATTAMNEVNTAVDFLFNHANTAPFVSYRLIQRLVTSNPTNEYVGRVSAIFANNGSGVRGDMKAVIKAILLDPEARSAAAYLDESNGKLREPFVRYTHIGRALPNASHHNRYWNNGFNYLDITRQHVMASPTVFNFYLPDFQPVGDISNAELVAPEFKIHNTATSVGYINAANSWFWSNSEYGGLMNSWEGEEGNQDGVWLVTDSLQNISGDSEDLINELDKIFTHGQLSDETRQVFRNALNPLYWTDDNDWLRYRARMAIYLMMISPDYNCVK